MKIRTLAASLSVVALSAGVASAEVGFGLRDSQLEFFWLYGKGGDVRAMGGSQNPTQPLLSDGAGLIGGDTDEGGADGDFWSATASWRLNHGYAVSGTRDDVHSIAASGNTYVQNFANGGALTEITGRINLLRLEFEVGGNAGSTTQFNLRVLMQETGALADAGVRIDTFTPFGWTAVTVFESNAGSSFLQTLNLGPGLYRIEGSAYARQVTDPSAPSANYQYTLTVAGFTEPDFLPTNVVPEPASALAILGSVGALTRRRLR
jgi:hypothetical protein